MAAVTKISWADSTANLWIGCVEVSPACDHCYARELAERYGWATWGGPRVYCKAGWATARKYQRAAARNGGTDPELGRRRRIFVNSLSDFFDNHKSIIWRDQAWQLMRECPDVIFMLLTKRPENIRKMLPADWGDGWDNVWIGTTVEDQVRAARRIPILMQVPAVLRFLSMEPLLEQVRLDKIQVDVNLLPRSCTRDDGWAIEPLTGRVAPIIWHGSTSEPDGGWSLDGGGQFLGKIGWVIDGGESGGKARVTHPYAFRRNRDDCAHFGTPYHHKQNGEFVAGLGEEGRWIYPVVGSVESYVWSKRDRDLGGGWWAHRVGTKHSGHLLDGEEHLEFPEDRRLAA